MAGPRECVASECSDDILCPELRTPFLNIFVTNVFVPRSVDAIGLLRGDAVKSAKRKLAQGKLEYFSRTCGNLPSILNHLLHRESRLRSYCVGWLMPLIRRNCKH